MNKYINSKWTSIERIHGWKHYEVRNVLKKQKKLELFAVCDKHISIIINIDEIKNLNKWIAGWKRIKK